MARGYGQYDGFAHGVELIGERWALLIVRDLLVGARRYTDLKHGLPRIPTNILSTRLKELQEGGIVRRVPLANCGLVYELTGYGRRLEPIVLALGRWGSEHLGEPQDDEVVTADGLTVALRSAFRPDTAATWPPTDYELRMGAIVVRVRVAGTDLIVHQVAPPASPVAGRAPECDPDVVLSAGPGLLRGEGAVHAGGDGALVERFTTVFTFRRAASPDRPAVG